MKHIFLTAVALFISTLVVAQTSYEMVVEQTNGAKSIFRTSQVKQTYFREVQPEPTGTFQGAKRVFGNNLVKAFGEEGTERYEVTYDSKGFVTAVSETYHSEYSESDTQYTWLFSYQTEGKILVSYYRDGMLDEVYHLTIGSNGYISTIKEADDFEAKLYYDNDEHLIQIVAYDLEEEEGASIYYDIETFSWMDGDMVADNYLEYGDEDDITNIAYISPSQTTPIENVAGVMEYDHGMGLDFDEFCILYYMGGFGKGTKHLPMAWNGHYSSGSNTWTLDGQNRPVKMVNVKTYHDSSFTPKEMTFFWEW